MNNVYNEKEIFSYDNKAMTPVATPDHRDRDTKLPMQAEPDPKEKPRKRYRNFLRLPFILNLLIAITVLTFLYLLEFGIIPGNKVGFICNDRSLSYKYKGDTISPAKLLIGSALIGLLAIVFTEFVRQREVKYIFNIRTWTLYSEFLIGCTLVLLITEIIKIIVGEHRPHFFDVCQPNSNKNCINGTYVTDYTCTTLKEYSNYFLTDTSRSFPSGHSSVSVFVSLFCSYIVLKRLPSERTGRLSKPFLISLCLTWCLVCSLTRITDRRHHWWDVLVGMILGVAGAVYSLYLLNQKHFLSDTIKGNRTSDIAIKENTGV